MRRTPLLIALLLAAAPAAAQQTIHPGQRVTGELSRADSSLPDGTYYDVWRFQGEAEHRYRITMRSGDFDAILAVGAVADAECESCVQNDDGGGGFDAEVEFVGTENGTYEIRANSVYEATGQYELILEDEGVPGHEHGEEADAPSGTPIAMGDSITGRLERGDVKVDNGYSDTYTYQGREGESISITLRSDDFQGYLTVGAFEGGECTQMDEAHDWGESGTRLTLTLPDDGAYHIHVGAQRQPRAGSYTLVLQRARFEDAGHAPRPVAAGQAAEGALAEGDAREANGAFADVFSYRGRAGETLIIDLESDEFDAFLHFGRAGGGEWQATETDDDGGDEGTSSRITVTLPADGEYHIHASSLSRGQTGDYTLRVRSQ